jgi:hypothetical protein
MPDHVLGKTRALTMSRFLLAAVTLIAWAILVAPGALVAAPLGDAAGVHATSTRGLATNVEYWENHHHWHHRHWSHGHWHYWN